MKAMAIDMGIPILVVDDYPSMITMIKRMLQNLGFANISPASDGIDAMTKLKAGRFRLVISDLRMDKVDGLELLRQVRADEALHKLPFIMVTAVSDRQLVVEAKSAGVTDYIVKPFNTATLKTKLTKALGTF